VIAIAEKGIIHRDISFQNIRIDDQHKLKVCDFDMAAFIDHQASGVGDRTGTLAFMAMSLSSLPCTHRPIHDCKSTHRPIHDCESIFWLCTLDLLYRVGTGDIRENLADIASPSNGIRSVMGAKKSLIFDLSLLNNQTQRLGSLACLDDPKDSSLFFCLIMLTKELLANNCTNAYQNAKFENDCFDRCIGIIRQALDPVTGGIAKISLSP
jgi:Fungal protein kinase